MKNILVTGGAGFVGSWLALAAKTRYTDAKVTALDNLKRRGSELNLPRLKAGGVDFIHGDIRNPEDLAAAGPADLLLECSAEPSVMAGYGGSPAYVVNTNLLGTVNCLEHARRYSADMVFLSTSRVYPMATIEGLEYTEQTTRFDLALGQDVPGVSQAGFSEEFPLTGARSLYGATKLASELLITEYRATYGLRAVVNRCGVITGPWQMGKVDQGVVVLWAARHVFGGALQYIGYGGTGKQVRDLLHVADLCGLVFYQVDHLDTCDGATWNVGGGRGISLSLCEMTALCQELTGNTIDIGSAPQTRPGDIRYYITDHTKVTGATGWRPKRDARNTLEDIVRWLTGHRDTLAGILG
ncbi:MAG: NAD-dependent epimerase/dehydratase family protein [Candidatus Hydrogenedentota bacterium]